MKSRLAHAAHIVRMVVVLAISLALLPVPAIHVGAEGLPTQTGEYLVQLGEPPAGQAPASMAPAAWPAIYRHRVRDQLVSYLPQLARLKAEGLVQGFDLLPEQNAIKLIQPQAAALQQARSWPGVETVGAATAVRQAAARENVERGLRDLDAGLLTGADASLQAEDQPRRQEVAPAQGVSGVNIYANDSYLYGWAAADTDIALVLEDTEGSIKAETTTTSDSSGYFNAYFSAIILGGDTVQITPDGESTVSIYVTPLTAGADKVADTVSGQTAATDYVTVQLRHYQGSGSDYYYEYPTLDAWGNFVADFGAVDIFGFDRIRVYSMNLDGHTIRIEFYVPGLVVNVDYDSVYGDYLAPNAPVQVVLKGPGGLLKATHDTTTSFDGYFNARWVCNDLVTDIAPGDTVEVTVGGQPTISIGVPSLTVVPDAAGDTVAGTAPPGAKVEVTVWDNETDESATQTIQADGGGSFLVDFSAVFDIKPADLASAAYHDALDHEVYTGIYVPGLIRAETYGGGLEVYDTPGTSVHAVLKNSLGAIKATASGAVEQDGNVWLSLRDSDDNYVDAVPTDQVEVTIGGGAPQTIEILPLVVYVDRDAATVFGSGPPNTQLLITVDYGDESAVVTTGPDGSYSVGFGRIVGGYGVAVYYTDPGGNQLELYTYAPQFTVTEGGEYDYVNGDAPLNTLVVFTVKDNGGTVKTTVTQSSGTGGWYWFNTSDLGADIVVGDRAEMTAGPVQTALDIVALTIAGDKDTDFVSGTAPPDAWLNVFADRYLGGVSDRAYKYFSADSAGNYSTNFGGGYDVRAGDDLEVMYWDDGHKDRVRIYRYLAPHIRVPVGSNVVSGYATPGDSGSVTVRNSVGTLKATAAVTANDLYGFFTTGGLASGGLPIEIVPGDRIEVTVGSFYRNVVVPNLDASLDMAADMVTVTGPPNDQLAVSVYHWRDGYFSNWTSGGRLAKWVTTDWNGRATFDCYCLADLVAGDYVRLYYLDSADNYFYQTFSTTSPTLTVTDYPAEVLPYGLVTVDWTLGGGVHPTSTRIRWDTESHALDNYYSYYSDWQTGVIGDNSGSFVAPTAGMVYLKVHAAVDGNDLYSGEYAIAITGDMPTTIVDPVSGTTNNATQAVRGAAMPNADIEIYEGTTLLATGTADDTGDFEVNLALPLGGSQSRASHSDTYPLWARATVEGIPPSDSNVVDLTLDPSLLVDPVHITAESGGVKQFPRDYSGRANLGGRVWTRAGDVVDLFLPIKCTNVISAGVYVNDKFAMSLIDRRDGVWVGTYTPPASGTYQLKARVNCNYTIYFVDLFTGIIDPDDYVYDEERGADYRISGAEITCFELIDEVHDTWQVWKGAVWGQRNPQTTPADGYFRFFALPGKYRLKVKARHYYPYQSPAITVIDEPVRYNIALRPLLKAYLPLVLKNH